MPTISQETKNNIMVDIDQPVYYFYNNWQAGQSNMIHEGSCNFCKYGFGMRDNQNRGHNGVWVGPFDSIELVNAYLENNGFPRLELHNCLTNR